MLQKRGKSLDIGVESLLLSLLVNNYKDNYKLQVVMHFTFRSPLMGCREASRTQKHDLGEQ